jgi:hypothetical protein
VQPPIETIEPSDYKIIASVSAQHLGVGHDESTEVWNVSVCSRGIWTARERLQ